MLSEQKVHVKRCFRGFSYIKGGWFQDRGCSHRKGGHLMMGVLKSEIYIAPYTHSSSPGNI